MPPDPLPVSCSPVPSNSVLDIKMLPDAVADAIAFVIAEKELEFGRMIEALNADHKTAVAELRATYAEQRLKDRDEIANYKAAIDGHLQGIKDAFENAAKEQTRSAGGDDDQQRDDRPAEKGEQGPQGPTGPQGEIGLAGRDGLPGVPGRDGKDGAAGRDGAGFDSWAVEYDGERAITFVVGSGEHTKKHTINLPVPIYRGQYRETNKYERGDCCTFQGGLWIAVKATAGNPERSDDWVLSTKRGAAGRDGKDGKDGEPGPQGKAGRDMTQVGPDGRKW